MKRLLLFLVFAGTGCSLLIWLAGGMTGTHVVPPSRTVIEKRDVADEDEHYIKAGEGLPNISKVEGITQLAPPRLVVWADKLSEETIEIHDFIPWRFYAQDATPMKRRDEGKQAVRCTGVRYLTFREPATRAEAMALVRSDMDAYEPLLHQTMRSDEARVFGRLADRMQRNSASVHEEDDTRIQLDGRVRIDDGIQGTTIKGDSVTVWPDQERADGHGAFTVEHEAFVLTGRRLLMEREKEKGWSRLSIMHDPVLNIVSDVKDRDGNPIFDFGPGDFRPAHITSEGRAILVREDRRRESVIRVKLHDHVNAEQEGGRSLTADGWVKLVAERSTVPVRRSDGRGPGWKLRHFEAQDKVRVEYPDETAQGKAYIASLSADRMTHDVPREGMPRTTLDGDPVILMRGELPLLGPGGRLRATCRDRAWIGAVPAGLPTSGLPAEKLQHIALRGQARVERTVLGRERSDDELEGDEIDLVVWQRDARDKEAAGEGPKADKMVATYFAALGHVRLGGTRIQGTAHRLVGEALHTERPHVVAEGRGKRFVFPNMSGNQRLLGPEPPAPPAADTQPSAPTAAAAAGPSEAETAPSTEVREKGDWLLDHLRAVGAVDIDTSMGGPAVGIPANIVGHEVTYDRLSSRAQVLGPDGRPARISWGSDSGAMNVIETPVLTLDRADGVVTAEGGVRGEIYMMRSGGKKSSGALTLPGPRRTSGDGGGAALTVRTDARIDIDLSNMGPALKPRQDAEMAIRIAGPVTSELRGPTHAVDRMQSDSLEARLVYVVASERAQPASAPASSTGSGADTQPRARRGHRPPAGEEPSTPERFEIEAGEMRAHLVEGEVHTLRATGKVDMRGESGHVSGEQLTYDAVRRQARVFASKPDWTVRPAVAILGDTEQRTEVRGNELAVWWEDGTVTSVEASSPRDAYASILMFSRDAERPGRLERYELVYVGSVHMTSTELRAGRIRLIRRIRESAKSPWGPPTALWAPTLRVLGRDMLSDDEDQRDMQRIIAEGPGTTFQAGEGDDLIKAWGHVFDYDVATKMATLTGEHGSDATIKKGDTLHLDQSVLKFDMNTNMPTHISGGRIFVNPKKKKPK